MAGLPRSPFVDYRKKFSIGDSSNGRGLQVDSGYDASQGSGLGPSRMKSRLGNEYANAFLGGPAPQNSSTQPIMTTSQRRLLAGARQVAPPRPEDDTRTLLQNGMQPGMHGAGDVLSGGSVVVMNNGVPGLAPPQEYTDNTGAFNERQRRAFLNNNQGAAAERGLVQGKTGEWLPRQANGGPNAAQREQQRHEANAIRALNYIDPLTYNAMGNGLGYSPATGLGGYQGQVAYQQNMQRNAQIPWVQRALGSDKATMEKQNIQAAFNKQAGEQKLGDAKTRHDNYIAIKQEREDLRKQDAGRLIPLLPHQQNYRNELDQIIREHEQSMRQNGDPTAPPVITPNTTPLQTPSLRAPESPMTAPRRGIGRENTGDEFPSFPKHEPKDNAPAPNLGNATPLPPLTSTSNERGPMSFVEKLQMMSSDKKAQVQQMVEAGIPVQQAMEHAAPELFHAEAKKPVGKSQNVARATIKSKPQGLRRPTQPKTWMQTVGLA